MKPHLSFGEFLKERRIARRLTLRQCAFELRWDASNWSKMERGITPAPKDLGEVSAWADFLQITGEDRQTFLDLAALSRNEIPADLATDEAIISALPAFFRAVRGHELSGKRLADFIEDLRAVNSPDKEK